MYKRGKGLKTRSSTLYIRNCSGCRLLLPAVIQPDYKLLPYKQYRNRELLYAHLIIVLGVFGIPPAIAAIQGTLTSCNIQSVRRSG